MKQKVYIETLVVSLRSNWVRALICDLELYQNSKMPGGELSAIDLGQTKSEVVRISSGNHQMGSNNELFAEAFIHDVTLTYEFYLGKYLITQHQWENVMGNNPSYFKKSAEHPVDSISWQDAKEFCNKLSDRSGFRVRLPSESEWEYGCRAGTTSDFYFTTDGPFLDDTSVTLDVHHALREYAWFEETSGGETQAVGMKKPNPCGIHDIIGNVWEWCEDVWHSDYDGAPSDGSPWISDSDRQPRRCLRGGAWDMNAFRCRSTYRSYDWKEFATNRFGLRIVAYL